MSDEQARLCLDWWGLVSNSPPFSVLVSSSLPLPQSLPRPDGAGGPLQASWATGSCPGRLSQEEPVPGAAQPQGKSTERRGGQGTRRSARDRLVLGTGLCAQPDQ